MNCYHTTECPICMESFNNETQVNMVVTECGHTFHTNCLMKAVAHNGFGCPYCRTTMAEKKIKKYDEDDEDSDDYDDDDYEDEGEDEEEWNNNYYCGDEEAFVLDGVRWLFNRVNNEDTIVFEYDDDHDYVLRVHPTSPDTSPPSTPKPSVEFITKKLVEQGVNMEDLVKAILSSSSHEEYEMEDEFIHAEDVLFGQMRILISNYQPEQESQLQEQEQVKREEIKCITDSSYYNNRFMTVV